MANPNAPAHIRRPLARFLVLDHLDDLFVGEPRLQLPVVNLSGLYTKLEEVRGLRSRYRNLSQSVSQRSALRFADVL